MTRISQLIFLILLLSASTARALTPPIAVPDATRVRTTAIKSIHPNIRLAIPSGQRAWSQIGHGFTPDRQSSMLNTQRAIPKPSIRFTPNLGQIADTEGRTRPEILYTADADGVRLFFTARGVSYRFSKTERAEAGVSEATGRRMPEDADLETHPPETAVYRMDMIFEGSNPFAHVRAEDVQQGYTNYYYAHCPDGITYVKSYGKIVYEDLYNNIDLVYYSSLGHMKYEFHVRPGGDPSDIRLRYNGAIDMALNADGDLTVCTPLGRIQEASPYSYQDYRMVESSFAIDGEIVSFAIGAFDTSHTLIIDPWSTYCGGSASDQFFDCACDANGNSYIFGKSDSQDFPVVNAVQAVSAGSTDLVIVSYDAYGAMQWSTYYGGSGYDGDNFGGIAVDGSGNAFICSTTSSDNFPVTPGAFQTVKAMLRDGCIVKFTSSGSREWATFYGGDGADMLQDIDLDSNGNIIITGQTMSTNFPVLNAYQSVIGGSSDALLIHLTPGGQRNWATYFGGSYAGGVASPTNAGLAIVSLSDGSVAVTGTTLCLNFPLASPFQSTNGGDTDAFLARFSSTGGLLWSTYFGGSRREQVFGICRDASDNIVFGGYSSSHGLATPGAFQTVSNSLSSSDRDGIVAKFSANGSRIWCSYLGGSGTADWVKAVKAGSNNTLYLAVYTNSNNMPVLNAYQSVFGGNQDAYCASFSENGALLWATYFGGSDGEVPTGLSLGQNGDVLFCGSTGSTNFPLLNAQQPTAGGGGDGFIVCLNSNGYFPVSLAGLTATVQDTRVVLEWITESESNNTGFIIERAAYPQEDTWERRGFIAGAGTTNAPHVYSFTDELPAIPSYGTQLYYRLRQIDTDGSETLSPVVTVTYGAIPTDAASLSVYPNPVTPDAWVELRLPSEQEVSIVLYDRLGRELRQLHSGVFLAGAHVLALDLNDLPPGTYFLRAEGVGHIAAARIVVNER